MSLCNTVCLRFSQHSRTRLVFRELEKTQNALIEYIEATYHITNEHLLRRRRELLETNGVVSQLPYIESTAKYDPGKEYQDLGLPDPGQRAFDGAGVGAF